MKIMNSVVQYILKAWTRWKQSVKQELNLLVQVLTNLAH